LNNSFEIVPQAFLVELLEIAKLNVANPLLNTLVNVSALSLRKR
jgi:hypothetical protein